MKVRAGFLRAQAGGRGVLLAVSGGGDSMALLDLAARVRDEVQMTSLQVACINHGLRPEAPAEVSMVGREARARSLPFHTRSLDLPRTSGLEARAREARYEALEAIRREASLDLIATAHTATDQAETLLMRLARGVSLSGASSIREKRGSIIRPMLRCTREEVRDYLAEFRIPWVDDPMNVDPAFLRTRIRAEVVPALERAAGPGASERLAHFAQFAAEDSEVLDEMSDAALRRLALEGGGFDLFGVRALPRSIRRRLIARVLAEAGTALDGAIVERVDEAILGKDRVAGVTLAGGAVLRVDSGRVRVVTSPGRYGVDGEASPSSVELDGPAVWSAGRWLSWSSRRPEEPGAQPLGRSTAKTLLIRGRMRGDRVRLPSGRTRKLQDILVDVRVPRESRGQLQVLAEVDGPVLCVPGIWPPPGTREPRGGGTWVTLRPAAH